MHRAGCTGSISAITNFQHGHAALSVASAALESEDPVAAANNLPLRTKLAFGVGASAEGAVNVAFNTWNFLFYNQVLGLSGTLAGMAVTVSLVLDAIAEPLVGSVSDRFRSRLGRRHPFLYAAPVPLALFGLYMPPAGLQGTALFLWFCLFSTLHRQALTLYQVPHLALGAELTSDYHQRSVVMSYTAIFGTVGAAATFMCGWTWFARVPGGTAARTGYAGLGLGVGVLAALLIFASAHFTRDRIPLLEPARAPHQPLSASRLWSEIKRCLESPSYRAALGGLLCLSATMGVRETLNAYVNLFFWELPANKIRIFGSVTPPAFLCAFLLTARLHRRFEKRNTIIFSLLVLAFASVAPVLARFANLLPANSSPLLLPCLMAFTFLFYGAAAVHMISVLSIIADVADEHELRTGTRQEGMLYAARTFFSKLSSGLGHLVGGLAVDIIAFPTRAKPGEVAHNIVDQLALLDGPISAIPALGAILCYRHYAIDRERHAEIRAALAGRRAPHSSAAAEELDASLLPSA
jgi:glycoside/pentoside/hexuronide:cation symporter, GPH family